jgi:RNA ligase
MKLTPPKNENYAATVVAITRIVELANCDNVVGTPLLGFQAIVGKDTQVGDLGIVFPAETQASEEYARLNNLHRHPEKNDDADKKGYLEDSRRIKAIKFRGQRSDCLFMPLDSLTFTGADLSQLAIGDTFDELNGHDICRKYQVKVNSMGHARTGAVKQKLFKRVDEKFLPEHYDTGNFFRNRETINAGQRIVVTQKLHGTSIRIGNTVVKRQLKLRERIAARFGVKVAMTEFDNVYGSRKVIKDVNNPHQNHYYGSDIWSAEGARLNGLVPENFIVYGELIGWTSDFAPIQKNYTYQVPEGTAELYVYRVAFVNGQGRVTDLAWDQVKEFCLDLGLKHVPELWVGPMGVFEPEDFLDHKFNKEWGFGVPLAKESPCDEGVCVRVDGLAPYILKAKSPKFLQHETKMLDQEAVDLEADESVLA